MREVSTKIVTALTPLPTLTNVQSGVSQLTSQVTISPDPTKSPLGNTVLVGSQIRNLLQGQNIGTICFSNGQELEIRLTLPRLDNTTNVDQYVNNLKQLTVVEGVKLGDIARVERVESVNVVSRINQAAATTIKATINTDDTGGVSSDALEKAQSLTLPAGVTVSLSGSGQQQNEAFGGLFAAIAVAIGLVYIVMVITFGSLLEPFAILFSLPLAFIGAIGALVVTQRALGLPALIGLLLLIGIVVTNAIVLLDLVKQLRDKGYTRNEALLQAGRTRLRPILMTAIATILALMPLALGFNEGSIIAAELGTVVIGGLLTSTLLTLLVVPVVYSLLEGGKERLGRLFNRNGDSTNSGELDKSLDINKLLEETQEVEGSYPTNKSF